MARSKAEKHRAVFEAANAQLSAIVDASHDDREQALEDRRFVSIAGAQWDGAIGQQFENKIKLESNKIHLAVVRITNDYRNNRVDAKFISKDGTGSDEFSDFLAGLYRADQQDSYAEEALDNAFEEALCGGFGAYRLTNEYEDEYRSDDERQRIRWEPITDADTCVYFDPASKRQDKSDAKYCFVLSSTSQEAFQDEWGEDVASFEKPVNGKGFDWSANDVAWVAEYYVCEDKTHTVYTYRAIDGTTEKIHEKELTDEMKAKLNDIGSILVSSRKVKSRAVRKYFLSGCGVLEDAGLIAGRNIPIIPVFGKRWFVDGKERFMGHVRIPKDMQRLNNMQLSALAEIAASGGEETPIFTPEQIVGHEDVWASKAVDRPAFLTINALTDADGNELPSGPIDYTRTAQVPAAMAALIELSQLNIDALLGNQSEGEVIEANTSGKAVELVQNRLDMQAYIYMSNFAKAVRRSAEVWLSMAADVYDEDGRSMKLVDEQGQAEFKELGASVLGDDGSPKPEFDLPNARMDVAIEIGPTSQSKKASTVRTLTSMLGMVSDPQDQAVISAMALMNAEGEGIGPLRDYYRKKMISMGVIEPTDQEAQEIAAAMEGQPQEPSAQDAYLIAEAKKSEAQAIESEADAVEAMANTELTKAKTAKTLADIDNEARDSAISAAKALADATTAPSPTGVR